MESAGERALEQRERHARSRGIRQLPQREGREGSISLFEHRRRPITVSPLYEHISLEFRDIAKLLSPRRIQGDREQ